MTRTTIRSEDISENAVDTTDIQTDIALLGFKVAANGSLAAYGLSKQAIDAFEDTSGVDSGASSSATRNAASYYSGTSSGSGDATGGSITYSGGNTIHTFNTAGNATSTNDFVVPSSGSVDYLVVAGGGGGGSGYAGGGGAGGMLSGSGHGVTAQTYTITVGAGGTGGGGPDGDGADGDDSVFSSFTAVGGGGGAGSGGAEVGNSGGSGGGGNDGTGSTSSGTAGQGSAGGYAGFNTGGGGGGKSSAGGNTGNNAPGGNGGNGAASSISGSSVTYAGGGGGGSSVSTGGAGGSGGGGNGAGGSPNTAGSAGTDGLGGGGGGGSGGASYTAGYDGGNGVVIVAYTTNSFTVTTIENMTLVSNASTADSVPSYADIVMTYTNGAGTTTINTDLKAYVSRDGGTTWTQATLVADGTSGGHSILVAHNIDISSQPSGTSMKYKIETLNQSASKETRIQAVSLGWK